NRLIRGDGLVVSPLIAKRVRQRELALDVFHQRAGDGPRVAPERAHEWGTHLTAHGGGPLFRVVARGFRNELPVGCELEADDRPASSFVGGRGELAWRRVRMDGPHDGALDRISVDVA